MNVNRIGNYSHTPKTPPIVLSLVGEIEEEMAAEFIRELGDAQNQHFQETIPVIIHSGGGDCYSALQIIEAIENSKKTVATICTGFAASAAAAIFACGHSGHRFMGPHSSVMIHDASISIGSSVTIRDLAIESKELEKLNNNLFTLMGQSCHKDENYFKKLLKKHKNRDLYLTPAECLKNNICTTIGLPSLDCNVSYNVAFTPPGNQAADVASPPSVEVAGTPKKSKRQKKSSPPPRPKKKKKKTDKKPPPEPILSDSDSESDSDESSQSSGDDE
jgi:ATP-dependent Clp endopeptidase proteolytic subunit ClpP